MDLWSLVTMGSIFSINVATGVAKITFCVIRSSVLGILWKFNGTVSGVLVPFCLLVPWIWLRKSNEHGNELSGSIKGRKFLD
jgi:hypothetical protein